MNRLRIVVLSMFSLIWLATSRPATAQNMWYPGTYDVSSYIEQVSTGTSTYYTISEDSDEGICQGYGGSNDDEDGGTGWGAAEFQVTFTFHGDEDPTTLEVQAEGDVSGNVTENTGTATATSYVSTDSAGALYYSNTALPNFGYDALGLVTDFTDPTSPMPLYITGSAEAVYSGYAQAAAGANVYFNY